ncbi:MAG: hypothetical protein HN916_11490 [Anaerolineae bacterium]|nr:hypothetical protein [Anaerolineae bacterium]
MERKRKVILLLFLLLCCMLTIGVGKEVFFRQPIKAFELSEECPNICWLGIHPGTTTTEETLDFLFTSNLIDRDSIVMSSDGIRVAWVTQVTNIHMGYVGIAFEEELVTVVSGSLSQVTVGDVIQLLGEPDEISFELIIPPDSAQYILYMLHYSSPKAMFEVDPVGHIVGPASDDSVNIFYINASGEPISNWKVDAYKNRQPWLGYGHLEEYLPEEDIP